MTKKGQTIPVHEDLIERNATICGPRSFGRTIRHSIFLIEEDLQDPEIYADIVLQLADECAVESPEMPQSVLFPKSDLARFDIVKAKLFKFKVSAIIRVAVERYLQQVLAGEISPETRRNSQEDAFVDEAYRREILVSWEHSKLIQSRYGPGSIQATVRAAVDFVAEAYDEMKPWADVTSVTKVDKIFFNPGTKKGTTNVQHAETVKINFYKQTQIDMEMLQEDYEMTFNETVRFCLELFLTIDGWQDRVLKRDSHFSGTRLSKDETSRPMSFMLDVDLEKELKEVSPNGKIQPPARAAIAEYLATSPYAKKLENDPTWSPGRPEILGVAANKVAVHVVVSQFKQLTIAATWEKMPRSRLLDHIFQEYLKRQKTPV